LQGFRRVACAAGMDRGEAATWISGRDEVRVHDGARRKGPRSADRDPRRYHPPPPKGPEGTAPLLAPLGPAGGGAGRAGTGSSGPGARADDSAAGRYPPPAAKAVGCRAGDEYRRLLYVAMTARRRPAGGSRVRAGRAEGPRTAAGTSLSKPRLKPDAAEAPADDGDGLVWRWRKSSPEEEAGEPPASGALRSRRPLPCRTGLTHVGARPRPALPARDLSLGRWRRRRRQSAGRVMPHAPRAAAALVQPAVAGAGPAMAAGAPRRGAARAASGTGEGLRRRGARQPFAREVLGLLADPHFAPLFAPARAPRCRSLAMSGTKRRTVSGAGRPPRGHRIGGC